MTAWIYIILSSVCSILVVHLLKVVESRKLGTLNVLTVNYLVASSIAFLGSSFSTPVSSTESTTHIVLLAVFIGIIFIVNYFIYSKSVHQNGMGVSVAMMRISLIIPVLLSTFWYMEYLFTHQWIGIILVFVTFYLLIPEKKSLIQFSWGTSWLLVFLFFFTGIGDASLKIYESDFSHIFTKQYFMGLVYLSSFLTGIAVTVFRGHWKITKEAMFMGIAVGIPNLFSALFLIDALSLVSGGIAYTSINLLTVVGATVLGILKWQDQLSSSQIAGLVFTIAALLLMV